MHSYRTPLQRYRILPYSTHRDHLLSSFIDDLQMVMAEGEYRLERLLVATLPDPHACNGKFVAELVSMWKQGISLNDFFVKHAKAVVFFVNCHQIKKKNHNYNQKKKKKPFTNKC